MEKLKKPISKARLAANRANAQKSTGPRTEAGKRRSSQNAFKHGLTASDLTAIGEDRATLAAFEQRFLASWNPQTSYETTLVLALAGLQLRLNRFARVETGLFDSAMSPISAADSPERVNAAMARSFSTRKDEFTILSRYEANLSRQYDRTLKQLLAARKEDLTPDTDPPQFFDETKPFLVENTDPSPPNEPAEPNESTERDIRYDPDPPLAGPVSPTRRHGYFKPLPKPAPQPVRLVFINDEGVESDMPTPRKSPKQQE